MNVALQTDRQGDRASLTLTGAFDLSHAMAAAQAVENAETRLSGCVSVDVDLAQLDRIDGAGAVLLARLCDRLDAAGHHFTSRLVSTLSDAQSAWDAYREHLTEHGIYLSQSRPPTQH